MELSLLDGLDITADGRFKDVLPIILSHVDKPLDIAKFSKCSRSARAWTSCQEVKYLWLKEQRPYNALLLASKSNGSEEQLFLRLLRDLGLGAGADARDLAGNTPLHYCCASGWDKAVGMLAAAASRGSLDARVFNKAGLSPLHIASAAGRPGCVEQLLNVKGSEVNARVCGGDTPLYLAYEGRQLSEEKGLPTEGYTQCIKLLVDVGGISFSGKQLALM